MITVSDNDAANAPVNWLGNGDDGAGMAEEDKEKSPSKGSHYGMKNIGLRLSVFYQEEIKMEIESTKGIGTCVSINIPKWSKNTERSAEK